MNEGKNDKTEYQMSDVLWSPHTHRNHVTAHVHMHIHHISTLMNNSNEEEGGGELKL